MLNDMWFVSNNFDKIENTEKNIMELLRMDGGRLANEQNYFYQ